MTQSNSESNSSAPLGAQQESLQQLDLLQGFPALRDALIPATPEPVNTEGITALPAGQVVTAYGYTCKSVNTGKVHCVSATNGFTLDSVEVGVERL